MCPILSHHGDDTSRLFRVVCLRTPHVVCPPPTHLPLLQTEDIEYTMRALLGRVKIRFCPEARSGELPPASFSALWRQRLRWAIGWDQASDAFSAPRPFWVVCPLPLPLPSSRRSSPSPVSSAGDAASRGLDRHVVAPPPVPQGVALLHSAGAVALPRPLPLFHLRRAAAQSEWPPSLAALEAASGGPEAAPSQPEPAQRGCLRRP